MKTILKFVAVSTAITLIGCSSSGNDADTGEISLPSMRTIESIEDFTMTIVDKTIVFRSEDGTRNPDAQLVIDSSMKVTGFIQSGEIDYDWYWENSAFCRSGVSGLPDNTQTVELECQTVAVDGNVVSFTRGDGTLSNWFIGETTDSSDNEMPRVRVTNESIGGLFNRRIFNIDDDGNEIRDNYFVLRDGGSAEGTWNNEPLIATWEMRDDFWCRVVTEFFNPDRIGFEDCQIWEQQGDIIHVTGDGGNGNSWVQGIGEEDTLQ